MPHEKAASLLHVSASPHMLHHEDVRSVMLSVALALTPALVGSVFFFGIHALLLTCLCVAGAVGAEFTIARIAKKPPTINDLSAVVTGMLLALSLPPRLPLWMGFTGSVFAIVTAKMAFGGLGNNFINPALAGRAFLMLSFPVAMAQWAAPLRGTIHGLPVGLDGVSAATPLTYFKNALASGNFHPLDFQDGLFRLFLGNSGGCLGETSVALLLAGALYLWYKRIMGFGIPLVFIGTFFFLFWMGNGTGEFMTSDAFIVPFYHLFSGGLMLGALYMAADPVTTPVTPWGRVVFGAGCGILTFIFRKFGGSVEGVGSAILLMNCCTPLIERYTRPKRYGEVRTSE
jgi:Na+-translocating ferredoxin:NAD+ oxidoreductase subunit D